MQRDDIPKFKVSGSLQSTLCSIDKPFLGELRVDNTSVPIKSIELQLVRVETCGVLACGACGCGLSLSRC